MILLGSTQFFLILRISFYYSVKMRKMVLITGLVLSMMVLFFLCSSRVNSLWIPVCKFVYHVITNLSQLGK